MRLRAPASPTSMPMIFLELIFSFIRITDKMSTKMGVNVTMTALLIGVVNERPLKNASIFIPMPKKAHKTNRR